MYGNYSVIYPNFNDEINTKIIYSVLKRQSKICITDILFYLLILIVKTKLVSMVYGEEISTESVNI